jgi:serine protease Do
MSASFRNKGGNVLAILAGTVLLAASPGRAVAQAPAGDVLNKARPTQTTEYQDEYRKAAFNALAVQRADATNFAGVVNEVFAFREQGDELLGATLQPVGDALRAQLDIAAGQGLLVAAIRADGPSAQAGLKQNDILLMLADKPLAAADDLAKQLKAAGEAAVALKVLRAGKPLTIQVRPIYRVTLGPVEERKTEYYIGVSIDPPDNSIRAQLDLPANQGVIINEVVKDSPAEKAGVKKFDIVLELAGKPIDKPETLSAQVQINQDKPTTLKLLRAGKPVSLSIVGMVRKVETASSQETLRYWLVDQPINVPIEGAFITAQNPRLSWAVTAAGADDVRQRLDQLEKELKALRRIEAVEKELKALHETLEKLSEALKKRE